MQAKENYSKYLIKIFFLVLFTMCLNATGKPHFTPFTSGLDTCRTIHEAQAHKNTDVIIIGMLQKFTPWEKGKGSGHMFWAWEIAFPDGGSMPIVSKDKSDGESIVFDEYENRNVIVYGTVFYGIVIGDSNPEHQSATGFRIDAIDINYDVEIPELKIKFNLSEFTDDGFRRLAGGELAAISYEFCIPAEESVLKEVHAIDSTAGVLKGSKGRSGCNSKEWLCIGNSRQPGFKNVIIKLAGLSYISKITETFWE